MSGWEEFRVPVYFPAANDVWYVMGISTCFSKWTTVTGTEGAVRHSVSFTSGDGVVDGICVNKAVFISSRDSRTDVHGGNFKSQGVGGGDGIIFWQ